MVRRIATTTGPELGFPHMRGDGPFFCFFQQGGYVFSPHAWGWSARFFAPACRHPVFPTCVGMVRRGNDLRRRAGGFPHMRGDGPSFRATRRWRVWFSPHAWGWSAPPSRTPHRGRVFPTCVGMVRGFVQSQLGLCRFPHMRGDGPSLSKWMSDNK